MEGKCIISETRVIVFIRLTTDNILTFWLLTYSHVTQWGRETSVYVFGNETVWSCREEMLDIWVSLLRSLAAALERVFGTSGDIEVQPRLSDNVTVVLVQV